LETSISGKYRKVRHRVGHEAYRPGYHLYLLPENESLDMLNFYFPKGLPTTIGEKRLGINVGPCTRGHFYDLEYKRGELLGYGWFELNPKGREKALTLSPERDTLCQERASFIYFRFRGLRNYLFVRVR
jgi:hypothetical protein